MDITRSNAVVASFFAQKNLRRARRDSRGRGLKPTPKVRIDPQLRGRNVDAVCYLVQHRDECGFGSSEAMRKASGNATPRLWTV